VSASERLRELQGQFRIETFTAFDVPHIRTGGPQIMALLDALPELAAVVEAAEKWDDGCCVCGYYAFLPGGVKMHAPDCALVALEAKLSL
jgi:hypothetical protein